MRPTRPALPAFIPTPTSTRAGARARSLRAVAHPLSCRLRKGVWTLGAGC